VSDPDTQRSGGGLPLFAFAVGGLLVGHALAYLIAVPDPHHRDLVLGRTGHAYLPTLAEVAIVLVLAAAAALVARVLGGRPAAEPSYRSVATRLAVLQVLAFGGQEVTERLVARVSLADLVHDHVLAIGVVAQVAVALAAGLLLRWLVRASRRVASISPAAPARLRPPLVVAVARDRRIAPSIAVRTASTVRGPPCV
jgi:hypothetical protein